MALPAPPPRMSATLPSAAVAPALRLRRHTAASLSSHCRRRWQGPAARRGDGPGAPLEMRGARWLPPPAPTGCSGASGATPTAAAAAAAAAGEAPYRGSEAQGSLWMVLLATAVVVCGSFEFGTCVGYSAPAQAGIVSDIGLSNSEVSWHLAYTSSSGPRILLLPLSWLWVHSSRETEAISFDQSLI